MAAERGPQHARGFCAWWGAGVVPKRASARGKRTKNKAVPLCRRPARSSRGPQRCADVAHFGVEVLLLERSALKRGGDVFETRSSVTSCNNASAVLSFLFVWAALIFKRIQLCGAFSNSFRINIALRLQR